MRIELTPPLYESGVIPLDHQCLCVSVFAVGPVGIKPTSFGLRDRCITLSATIPFVQSAWRELNPRPSSYKDAARTVELHAACVRVRPERFELSPGGLKVRCAAATPQPHLAMAMRFKRIGNCITISFVVCRFSGSPENRTQRHSVISRV